MRRLAALLALLGVALAGCTPGAKSPSKGLIECYAKALEPIAGDVYDTVELAKDLVSGKSSLNATVQNLKASEEAVAALNAALHACQGSPAPAVTDAGTGS